MGAGLPYSQLFWYDIETFLSLTQYIFFCFPQLSVKFNAAYQVWHCALHGASDAVRMRSRSTSVASPGISHTWSRLGYPGFRALVGHRCEAGLLLAVRIPVRGASAQLSSNASPCSGVGL
jgi:hypothetical protein